jgi:hypothetical protein
VTNAVVQLTYILPIRRERPVTDELLAYLDTVATFRHVGEVIVVDGSAPPIFNDFSARLGPAVRHVPVDADLRGLANGKVAGVLTGVRLASHDRLLLADDDVRYDAAGVAAIARLLDRHAIVRPQNFFDPLPWHACIDTARTLINRATGGDWPGTLGVNGAWLKQSGGYDGNVLFENLELVRTVRALGGAEARPLNLFVRRLPPDAARFWSQRVRQAYDEFARPLRMAFWLALLPAVGAATAYGGVRAGLATAGAAMGVAETGRRIGGGAHVFPIAATFVAPLWVLERGVCAWLALGMRLAWGGMPYAGRVLRRAATPSTLMRRFATAPPAGDTAPARQMLRTGTSHGDRAALRTGAYKGEHKMPNQTMPTDEFGHNQHGVASDAASTVSGAASTFREKAEQYLGGDRVHQFADAASQRVQATTDYLRNAGATRMRDDVEQLVKKNPGPAMLVAVTVGFLIGRTLNRHY